MWPLASACFRPWVLLAVGSVLLCLLGIADLSSSVTIIALALFQNTAYSLQSRARLRSSNLYHALAAVVATAVFFMTLRFLFASQVPLALLVPYTFGTLIGTVWGVKISIWIEGRIGAVANIGEEVKGQMLPIGPTVLILSILTIAQLLLMRSYDMTYMLAILGAAFATNFLFSGLTVARNTNAYWSHLTFVLIQAAVGLFTYDVMLRTQGDWMLFAPYITGTLFGSITGTWFSKRIEGLLKSSWDTHVLEKESVPWPLIQASAAVLLVVPQLAFFGASLNTVMLLVFLAALAQNCAFSLVSRARQRKHMKYLEWTSMFSNGIWFLTLGLLVIGSISINLYLPYIMGTAIGSLLGQGIAMRIERKIGAAIGDVKA